MMELSRVANCKVSNGIKWLDDIQSFYRERSIIEREYAQKLRSFLSGVKLSEVRCQNGI
jgi:hypothetical protein